MEEQEMGKKRVLVVEDEESLCRLETVLLEHEGFEVLVARTGSEALRVLEFVEPDVVLLDIMLPEVDGYEVCRQIRNRHRSRRTPVVMLSARTAREDKIHGIDSGATFYLTKPFRPDQVVETIQRCLH